MITLFIVIKPIKFNHGINWIKEKWKNETENIKNQFNYLKKIIERNPKKNITILLAAGTSAAALFYYMTELEKIKITDRAQQIFYHI